VFQRERVRNSRERGGWGFAEAGVKWSHKGEREERKIAIRGNGLESHSKVVPG